MTFAPRCLWGLVAATYFVVTTLAHLEFSLWLVGERTITWHGRLITYSFRDFMPYGLPVAALTVMAWLARDAWRHGTRDRAVVVAAYWLVWAACVASVDEWLTFSVAEYFHYPQYAGLAWLIGKTLDPERSSWPVGRVMALTALLGALDECTQYLWITTSYSHYFDFNDVLVNMLAAALGAMLYYGFRSPPAHGRARTGWHWHVGALALALGIGVAVGQERLQLTPPSPVPPGGIMKDSAGHFTLYLQRQQDLYDRWHPAAWRPRHWVLGPLSGLGLTGLVWAAWLCYPLRRRRQ